MNAISMTRRASSRLLAVIVTLLLFGLVAYLVSAFIWLLPHAPDAGAVSAILFAIRSVGDTYPGTLMTPAFLGAGLCAAVAGLWRGEPPPSSALVPWLVITLAIAANGLYFGETTIAGHATAWPFYVSDAIVACLCWAAARLFW